MGVTKTFSLLYSPFKFRIYTSKAIPYKNFGGEAAQKIEAEKLNPDRQAGSLTWLTWLTEWVDLIWLSQLSQCVSLWLVSSTSGKWKKGGNGGFKRGKEKDFFVSNSNCSQGKISFSLFPIMMFWPRGMKETLCKALLCSLRYIYQLLAEIFRPRLLLSEWKEIFLAKQRKVKWKKRLNSAEGVFFAAGENSIHVHLSVLFWTMSRNGH